MSKNMKTQPSRCEVVVPLRGGIGLTVVTRHANKFGQAKPNKAERWEILTTREARSTTALSSSFLARPST